MALVSSPCFSSRANDSSWISSVGIVALRSIRRMIGAADHDCFGLPAEFRYMLGPRDAEPDGERSSVTARMRSTSGATARKRIRARR